MRRYLSSVSGVAFSRVVLLNNALEYLSALITGAVAVHAHLGNVAPRVAVLGSLDGLERHELFVHLRLDERNLGSVNFDARGILHVRERDKSLDIQLFAFAFNNRSFLGVICFLDVGSVLNRVSFITDLYELLLVLGLDSQLPLLVFGVHFGLLFSKNLELGILLVLLFGDLFIDSLGVDRALNSGVGALLLHD